MISPVLSIDIDSSAQEVTMFMTANNIGSFLVKSFDEYGVAEEDKLLGVISVKDFRVKK